MTDRSKHGSLGSDNDPQFQIVSDDELTPDQLRQVQALRAGEATYTKPADTDPPSPTPSDGRGDQ